MKALVKSKAEPGVWMERAPKPKIGHNDVLINLSAGTHKRHLGFARVNEIVSADQASLEQGRVRYRFYKDQGHLPDTHKL
ncbi:MAG: DNA polymerase III subunit chi [Proteobacteria bacterium]|nr:DNA polymerase III subunit chi [Pseudomonadota bacterium]